MLVFRIQSSGVISKTKNLVRSSVKEGTSGQLIMAASQLLVGLLFVCGICEASVAEDGIGCDK